jgi:hypothetical protein
MPSLKIVWTHLSKRQFDDLRQRAKDTNHSLEFIKTHNEVVAILRDLDRATEKGDPLYHTKKPGGMVHHFLHEFISVTYAVFAAEQIGWVTNYVSVPATWPEEGVEQGPSNS